MAVATGDQATKQPKIPINFQLGDRLIDGATIRPATFATFPDCISVAHRMARPSGVLSTAPGPQGRYPRHFFRHQRHGRARRDNPDFYSIIASLDSDEGPPGNFVRDGDGGSIRPSITNSGPSFGPGRGVEREGVVQDGREIHIQDARAAFKRDACC